MPSRKACRVQEDPERCRTVRIGCSSSKGVAFRGDVMRAYGFTGIALLLVLAGAAQAVSTVSTWTDTRLAETEPGLVGPPGPWNEWLRDAPEQTLRILDESEGVLRSALEIRPDLWVSALGETTTSLNEVVEDAAEHATASPIGAWDPKLSWATAHHWSLDAGRYSDPGFVNAGGSIRLSTSDGVSRMPSSLRITRATYIMVIIVFPALAAMVLVLAGRLFLLRFHRRRSVRRFEQLLQA